MKNNKLILIMIIVIIAIVLVGVYFGINKFSASVRKNNDSKNTQDSINPAGKTYNIEISNFKFIEKTISIKRGDTVIWKNLDSVQHTVTSDSGDELNSQMISKEQTYSHTFNTAGVYNYHCTPHPMMKATVIVE